MTPFFEIVIKKKKGQHPTRIESGRFRRKAAHLLLAPPPLTSFEKSAAAHNNEWQILVVFQALPLSQKTYKNLN